MKHFHFILAFLCLTLVGCQNANQTDVEVEAPEELKINAREELQKRIEDLKVFIETENTKS